MHDPLTTAIRKNIDPIQVLSHLIALFKLRIVVLLLFSAIGGMLLSHDGWPGFDRFLALVISGTLTTAGASALNQYLERDVDRLMERTQSRPLASCFFQRPWLVVLVAMLLMLVPPLLLIGRNRALAFFLFLGEFIYLIVYTLWLKPRTSLNIVIGGAAGSSAVLAGSAAAGNWSDSGAVALALLLFLWTPIHFWSLAILHISDYARSGVPMLPSQTSSAIAARFISLHSVVAVLGFILLGVLPELGLMYTLPVALSGAVLIARSVSLMKTPRSPEARSVFITSNVFLAIVILGIVMETLW